MVAVADYCFSVVSWGTDGHDQRFGSGAVYLHALLTSSKGRFALQGKKPWLYPCQAEGGLSSPAS